MMAEIAAAESWPQDKHIHLALTSSHRPGLGANIEAGQSIEKTQCESGVIKSRLCCQVTSIMSLTLVASSEPLQTVSHDRAEFSPAHSAAGVMTRSRLKMGCQVLMWRQEHNMR